MPRISRKGSGPGLQAFKREFAAVQAEVLVDCGQRLRMELDPPNDSGINRLALGSGSIATRGTQLAASRDRLSRSGPHPCSKTANKHLVPCTSAASPIRFG